MVQGFLLSVPPINFFCMHNSTTCCFDFFFVCFAVAILYIFLRMLRRLVLQLIFRIGKKFEMEPFLYSRRFRVVSILTRGIFEAKSEFWRLFIILDGRYRQNHQFRRREVHREQLLTQKCYHLTILDLNNSINCLEFISWVLQ